MQVLQNLDLSMNILYIPSHRGYTNETTLIIFKLVHTHVYSVSIDRKLVFFWEGGFGENLFVAFKENAS